MHLRCEAHNALKVVIPQYAEDVGFDVQGRNGAYRNAFKRRAARNPKLFKRTPFRSGDEVGTSWIER